MFDFIVPIYAFITEHTAGILSRLHLAVVPFLIQRLIPLIVYSWNVLSVSH